MQGEIFSDTVKCGIWHVIGFATVDLYMQE